MGKRITITDQNYHKYMTHKGPDGLYRARGGKPRNFQTHPLGYIKAARPFDLPLIPETEQQDRLDAQKAAKAQLPDIRNKGMEGKPIPSRDQDGVGYCWCHSATSAVLMARAVANEPYVDLSAFAVGCMIKGFRDEGGWGAEAVEFIANKGIPSSEQWPQRSMDRKNDNPETWANAALHKNLEWMDLDPRNMKQQLITALLYGFSIVADYNRWAHSVLACALVSLNPFKHTIWNSWGDSWSTNGMGDLEGDSWLPDAGLAVRVVTPSEK